jgi:uncharacterized protein
MQKYGVTVMRDIFAANKVIAVVGLSPDPVRPSYNVAAYLQRAGYRIIPVNPSCTEILGEKCYARLLDIPGEVDIVDIFRRSEYVPQIVEEALAKKAKVLWMQEGVVNVAAAQTAERAGLTVVMDRCMLKEHRFLTITDQ